MYLVEVSDKTNTERIKGIWIPLVTTTSMMACVISTAADDDVKTNRLTGSSWAAALRIFSIAATIFGMTAFGSGLDDISYAFETTQIRILKRHV